MFKSLILFKDKDRYSSLHFGFNDKLDENLLPKSRSIRFKQELFSRKEDLDEDKFTILISRGGIYYTQLKDIEEAQQLICVLEGFGIDAEILG